MPPLATRIEQFVSEGGVCVFLPPGEPDRNGFLGFTWGSVEMGEHQIPKWNQDEGPLGNSDEGFALPVGATTFARRQQLEGPGTTLAAFADGSRFFVRQTVGRGEAYFMTSRAEAAWSSLWEGPTLVPAMQRMLQAGTRRLQTARMLAAGETLGLDTSKNWASLDSPGQKDVRMHAGVYRADGELVAVNRPAAEDDLETLDAEAAVALFKPVPVQMLGQAAARNERMQSEVWRLFLFGMLIFLLVEAFLILPERKKGPVPPGARMPSAPQPAGGRA